MKGTVNENVKQLDNVASTQLAKNLDENIQKKDPAKYQALPKIRHKMQTFSERLEELKPDLKDWYNGIMAEILSYKKVKSRISERYNTIRTGYTPLIRISLRKSVIRLYFNLDQTGYPKDFKLKDASKMVAFKKFPTLLTVLSERSYQNALTLINELTGKLNLLQNL